MEDSLMLLGEFEILLRAVAEGRAPIDDVEAWYQLNVEALRACDDAPLKSAVQRALVYTWSWRTGSSADPVARASLQVLAGRLQPPGQ